MKATPKIFDLHYWKFPIVILALCFPIAALGDLGRSCFRYEASALEQWQLWRWITGHITHLGWSHYILNGCGLLAVWLLYGRQFSARFWTYIFLLCSAGISLGFYLFNANLTYYVGLSGVLHGALAAALTAGLTRAIFTNDVKLAPEDVIITAGLILKILYEQLMGAVPLTQSLSGDTVIVDAHFYGAVIGSLVALLRELAKQLKNVRI